MLLLKWGRRVLLLARRGGLLPQRSSEKEKTEKTGLPQIKDVLTQCRDALKINEGKPGN